MATKKAASAKKTAPKRSAAPKPTVDSVRETVNKAFEDAQARSEEAFESAVKFTRDASYVSIGAPIVVGERLSNRQFELMDYQAFVDAAMAKGHERVADFQNYVEPLTMRVSEVIDPITERVEAQLPEQVRTTLQDSRKRMRELLDV